MADIDMSTKVPTVEQVKMLNDDINDRIHDSMVATYADINLIKSGAANHNSIYRGEDITGLYDSGSFSEKVADGSFDGIYLGDYIQRSVTISGTQYTVKGYVAHIDPFYAGYDSYAMLSKHHVGLFLVGLPNHNMNDSNITTGGYAGSSMHAWLTGTVLPALETAFGTSHLVAHQKLYSTEVDTTATNQLKTEAGASKSWAWSANQKISLLTEVQLYGSSICSSSLFDTGEGCHQLALFGLVNRQKITGNRWWWLRSVASSSHFCRADGFGRSSYYSASIVSGVCPLILLS